MLSILDRIKRIEDMLGIEEDTPYEAMIKSAHRTVVGEGGIGTTTVTVVDDAVEAEVVEQGCKTCYHFSFGHCDKDVDISEGLLEDCELYEILAPNISRITGESQKKPKIILQCGDFGWWPDAYANRSRVC